MTSRRMRITREGSSSQRDFDDYVWNTLKIIIPNYKDIFKYFFGSSTIIINRLEKECSYIFFAMLFFLSRFFSVQFDRNRPNQRLCFRRGKSISYEENTICLVD